MSKMWEDKAWSEGLSIVISTDMVNRVNEHLNTFIKKTIRANLLW